MGEVKKDADRKASLIDQINEMRKEYDTLSLDYFKKCAEFENETTELELVLETRAFEDFKRFFSDKGFSVNDEKSSIKAVYNEVKFEFSYTDNFYYSIHYYVNGRIKTPNCS
ncbi:hypothetical protein [Paenibacillus gorillae]|uniref:hypothetical protein n=1 Tax=Paenibacillus gorillae TaxID=1243662 RepID=UPI0005A81699|nr:hypothetical protein [Paenibacillus gorillae]